MPVVAFLHVTDCCTPDPSSGADPARTAAEAARLAALAPAFRALGDPARLRAVDLILAAGGEACVCDLTAELGLAQATVSHHLAVLVRAGLLARDKRGVWAWYSVRRDVLSQLGDVLRDTARTPVGAR